MVRNYKRKTNRGLVKPEDVMAAVRAVKLDSVSIRKAAKGIRISYGSLMRYLRKIPDSEVYDRGITKPSCTVGYSRKPPRLPSPVIESPRSEINLSGHGEYEGTEERQTESPMVTVAIKTEDCSESETELLSIEQELIEMGKNSVEQEVNHSVDDTLRFPLEMDASRFYDGLTRVPPPYGLGTSSQSVDKQPWKFQDEYEVAGWVIGNKLRCLNPVQRALAEKLIYDVLAKAVLKDLKPHTSITW